MESPETLSRVEKFEQQVREAIQLAIELAEISGEQVPIEPNTLGLLENGVTIEELDNADKGSLGKVVWADFGLPKGRGVKEIIISEKTVEITEGNVPGRTRERVFRTSRDNVLLHEILYSDGQKRFTVSVPISNKR